MKDSERSTEMPPTQKNKRVQQSYNIISLRHRLTGLHRTKSLRKISKEHYEGKVSHGTIDRIIKGHEPKRTDIREALGLPEIITVHVYRNRKGRFSKGDDDVA